MSLCVSVCMCVRDQVGYQLDIKKKQNCVQLVPAKRADLACSCLLWIALQVSGCLSSLTTLDYPVGLGMPKANVHCLGDPCGVCTLMNNLGFQEMRRKPILLSAW